MLTRRNVIDSAASCSSGITASTGWSLSNDHTACWMAWAGSDWPSRHADGEADQRGRRLRVGQVDLGLGRLGQAVMADVADDADDLAPGDGSSPARPTRHPMRRPTGSSPAQ